MVTKKYTFTATIKVTVCWEDDKYPGDEQARVEASMGAGMMLYGGNQEVSDILYDEEGCSEVIDMWAEAFLDPRE